MKNLKIIFALFALVGIVLSSCSKDPDDYIDQFNVFKSSVGCENGYYVALKADFNSFPAGTRVGFGVRSFIMGGIPIPIEIYNDDNGNNAGTKTSAEFEGSNVTVHVLQGNNPQGHPIILECVEETVIIPPGMLLNEYDGMNSAASANPNCVSMVLQIGLSITTENSVIPVLAGSEIIFRNGDEIDFGVYTATVHDVEDEATVTTFTVNGASFSVPFKETFSVQPRFICEQPVGPLQNQLPGMLTQWITQLSSCDLMTQVEITLDNGMIIPAGTWIEFLPAGINFGGLYVLVINSAQDMGFNHQVLLDGIEFSIPFENEIVTPGQLWLVCEGIVVPLPNETQGLLDAKANITDCISFELGTPMPTPNGQAPVGTIATFDVSAGTATFGTYYSFNISTDPTIAEIVEFSFDFGNYDIGLEGANANLQISLGCVDISTLLDIDDLIAAVNAANSNRPLLVEFEFETANGTDVPMYTVTSLSTGLITFEGAWITFVDETNGTLTPFYYGSLTYWIPISNGPSSISLRHEWPVSLPLPTNPVLHFPWRDLANLLGWDDLIYPVTGDLYFDDCNELRYTIPNEGIDYPMEMVVQIDNGVVTNGGVRIDNGTTTVSHWLDATDGLQKNLFYVNSNTTKYFPYLPGISIDVIIVCVQ